MKQFQQEFKAATVWLTLFKSVAAQLMYSSVNEVTDDPKMPTACTNYKQRWFNREWMNTLTPKQQAGIMAHESLGHECLMHQSRKGNRDHRMWNYACDLKINNLLLESGFELPAEGVFDYRGNKFVGHSEEHIYDHIEKEEQENPGGMGNYVPDMSEDEPSPDDVARIKGMLQAAIEMHGMGSMSKELQEAIGSVLNPTEKWYEWLRKYFISKTYSGCDWTQMCKREYMRTGLITPPFQSDTLGTVVWSIDQSGSISQEILDHVSGHLNSMMLDCRPTKVIIQYFDTEVRETEEYTMDDFPIQLRRVCGGGTDFKDICAKAEEHDAVVHVVLTDMEGGMPSDSSVPTIWADFLGGHIQPFGDLVEVRLGV